MISAIAEGEPQGSAKTTELEDLEKREVIQAIERIETPEDWQEFCQQYLGGQATPLGIEKLNEIRVHWRGLLPENALKLLTGVDEKIAVRSNSPNTTLYPDRAISYRGGMAEGESEAPFNVAVGFYPGDDWEVRPAFANLPEDLKKMKEVRQYREGNFICKGELPREKILCFLLRFAGQEPGKPGQPFLYKFKARPFES